MPSVTLVQLQARVWDHLDNNQLLYTAQNVTEAINECIRIVNLACGFLQATVQVPGLTQANRIFYDVPAGLVVPMRVQFEDIFLQKFFPNKIGMAYSNWVTDTTANTNLPVSEWIPCGFNKFAIHPADSIGGSPLFVTGVAEPTPLVNATDVILMPNEFTELIVNLGAQVLTLKETGALFKQSSLYYQQYLSLLKRMTIWRSAIMPRYYVPELVQKQ